MKSFLFRYLAITDEIIQKYYVLNNCVELTTVIYTKMDYLLWTSELTRKLGDFIILNYNQIKILFYFIFPSLFVHKYGLGHAHFTWLTPKQLEHDICSVLQRVFHEGRCGVLNGLL